MLTYSKLLNETFSYMFSKLNLLEKIHFLVQSFKRRSECFVTCIMVWDLTAKFSNRNPIVFKDIFT